MGLLWKILKQGGGAKECSQNLSSSFKFIHWDSGISIFTDLCQVGLCDVSLTRMIQKKTLSTDPR